LVTIGEQGATAGLTPLSLVLPGLAAFGLAVVLTKLVIVIAERRGLMSQPTEDRWHTRATPIFGGIAIYAAFLVTMLVFEFAALTDIRVIGLLGAGSLMFLIGLIDDVVHLRPHVKLLWQVAAAGLLIACGVYFKMFNPVFMIPVSVLWIIGITNAFNLLDNMDGLSGGIAMIACINMVVFDVIAGNGAVYPAALALFGALAGFLVFNFNPAKIFMGDSGSLLIGMTVAGLTTIGSNADVKNVSFTLLFPLLLVAVPLFDTTLVTVLRTRAGRSVAQGGRDHTSHRLVALGLSERKTVLVLYVISLLAGGLALSFRFLPTAGVAVFATLLLLTLYYFGRCLAQAEVYPRSFPELQKNLRSLPRRILTSAFVNRLSSTEVIIDIVLVGLSLTIGYLVKYEGVLSARSLKLIGFSLPIMIPVKLACLYFFGVYRQMWRYVAVRDLLDIFRAASLGSALSAIVLLFMVRFENYSRSVHIIDWLTFLALAFGSRLAIRLVRDSFLPLQSNGRGVVIYGAGDAGSLLIQEIIGNPEHEMKPVALFDDDILKHGRRIHRVPIIGDASRLESFCKNHKIRTLVVAIPSASNEQLSHIFDTARRCGLATLRFIPARFLRLDDAAGSRKTATVTGDVSPALAGTVSGRMSSPTSATHRRPPLSGKEGSTS